MPEIVKRGFVPSDIIEFNEKNQKLLSQAQQEVYFLLNRGYEMEKIITFVGNHYLFSARQRMALARASASEKELQLRKEHEKRGKLTGKTVYIDGFNLIITLEAALSGTTLLSCMDKTVRDLCGLHGTYRIIDKTEATLQIIEQELKDLEIEKAIFYLDAPMSNSGRLKQLILESFSNNNLCIEVELVRNADACLWAKEYVISSDAIILNKCKSWYNFVRNILDKEMILCNPICLNFMEKREEKNTLK